MPAPPALPAPFDDDSGVLSAVAAVTGEAPETVRGRLLAEQRRAGANVREEYRRRGLRPHQWDAEVEKLYAESEAPLYEGIVWNRSFYKALMRARIGRLLAAASPLVLPVYLINLALSAVSRDVRWGGRSYRLRGPLDVEVLPGANS
ncbi:MAG: hypothetical protein HY922_05925 [Elusimicrobia bacterium]|nr:hypothetical protein [Elusimicrobiota bacterium]